MVLANHPELLDDITRIWNNLTMCIDSNEESQEQDEKKSDDDSDGIDDLEFALTGKHGDF